MAAENTLLAFDDGLSRWRAAFEINASAAEGHSRRSGGKRIVNEVGDPIADQTCVPDDY